MSVWFNTIFSVLVISLISLVGVIAFALKSNKLQKILIHLVSFSAGSLFGDAFFHLLPTAAETYPAWPISVVLGILFFFILENFVHWRHCHVPTSHKHPHPVGIMNLVGDGFHNLLDGMIIAASYMAGAAVGVATTLAVILHEIPQEIGDFGILIHAGFKKTKALVLNLVSALLAVLGAVIVLVLGAKISGFSAALIPFTAGGFIYIAGSDLIPELRKQCAPLPKIFSQFLMFLAGIVLMYLLLFIE